MTTKPTWPQPELISVPEAAERCGVHYRTMRRWINDGRVKAVRVGPKLLKINAADLGALLSPAVKPDK